MKFTIRNIVIFAVLYSCQIVFANDTAISVASTGITFQKNNNISIEKESLEIFYDKINVEYEFFNRSNQDIYLDVAFPLPIFNCQYIIPFDELFIDLARKDGEQIENKSPFLDFKIYEGKNLKEIKHKAKFVAMKDGHDITDLLKKNKIPLSSLYLKGCQTTTGYLQKDSSLKPLLKRLHLLDNNELPNWQNQTIYTWKDKFAAQKKHYIKHEYSPAMGAYWTEAKNKPKTFKEINIKHPDLAWGKFCLTDEFKNIILQSYLSEENTSKSRRVWRVEYILKTGANWQGPIKHFHLEIVPPPHHVVSFCPPALGKIEHGKDGRIIYEVENFLPDKDLDIIFVDTEEPH